MMRTWIFMGLLTLLGACDGVVSERGNGNIESQKRSLESFREIHLEGNYQVSLRNGSPSQVVIVTDDNLLDFIRTEVEEGILRVDNLEKIYSKEGIKLYITYQQLEALESSKASVIKSEESIRGDRFSLKVTGAGLVELELELEEFNLDLPGAGLVKLWGSAKDVHLDLAGVGNLEAFDLESVNCEVRVSGVGGAQVNVKENLKASVNGIGGIRYKGNPRIIQEDVSGIGTIKKSRDTEDRKI